MELITLLIARRSLVSGNTGERNSIFVAANGTYTIGKDGVPKNIKITSPPNKNIDKLAIQVVSQDRYKPATRDGEPIECVADWTVNFRNGDKTATPHQ